MRICYFTNQGRPVLDLIRGAPASQRQCAKEGIDLPRVMAYIPETPAPVVTKHPPPQAPVVTKQLSLEGTQRRQAHTLHIKFFITLLNLPPSARIHHKASLFRCRIQREQYEWLLRERCSATGEQYDTIAMSIKGSIDAEMLNNMALYVLGRNVERLADSDIMQDINRRCSKVKNNHLPDVEAPFAEKLRMNLKEDDIEARILKYFACFNNIGGNYQLQHVMGHTKANDHDAIVQIKNRTKILIDKLPPILLKREIMRLVSLEYRKAKADEGALYNLILERAREHQHYFLMTMRINQSRLHKARHLSVASLIPSMSKLHERRFTRSTVKAAPTETGTSTPPHDGCLVCKGPHWVSACPKSSNAQKDESKRATRERMAARASANRATLSSNQESQLSAVLARNLEVPLLLLGLPPDTHVTTTLRHPVSVEVVGGATLVCRERVTLNVQVRTAAGPVNIKGVDCLVLDGKGDKFILGKAVFSSLGIDVGAMIAKLVEGPATDTDGDDLTTNLAVEVGVDVDSDILNLLSSLEHAALLEECLQPPPPLLAPFIAPDGDGTTAITVNTDSVARQLNQLTTRLQQMHKVVESSKRHRQQAARDASSSAAANFQVSDFILWSRVEPRLSGSKLMFRWVGPFLVTGIKKHYFEVENLITKARNDVHGSRIKLFIETALKVTEKLREHITTQGLVLGVREICDLRYNNSASAWELKVAWVGLEDAEASWQPFSSINADVPGLVSAFLYTHPLLPDVIRLQMSSSNDRLWKGLYFTKQLSLGGTQVRQAHSIACMLTSLIHFSTFLQARGSTHTYETTLE
uniref:Uncharacterized protein AlNc14C315G10527 n=1 Tax=Albugo laibachii Nc14 TaxID=890382 RepID=F0WW85_9STRA|nr:conserved hypothetical protein [Albugo laibachii Nc14]|eukprot:CCA25705.1 conserved hypothetical protein [Albugo laibachii Nc14]